MNIDLFKANRVISEALYTLALRGGIDGDARVERELELLGVNLKHSYMSPFQQLAELVLTTNDLHTSVAVIVDYGMTNFPYGWTLAIGVRSLEKRNGPVGAVKYHLNGVFEVVQQHWSDCYKAVGA